MVRHKVVILAFDGLDYQLVEKFMMINLMQREYGKVNVSDFPLLSTPILWSAFITGKVPDLKSGLDWVNPIERMRKMALKLGVSSPRGIVRKVLTKIGFKKVESLKKYRNAFLAGYEKFFINGIKTIFSHAEKPIALSVPTYSFKQEDLLDVETWISSEDKDLTEEVTLKMFEERKRKLLTCLLEEWDLLMAWFGIADRIGHLYSINQLTRNWEVYAMLDELVSNVKSRLNDDVLLLVVSDHGIEHAPYGFYSANKQLGLSNPKLTDFYSIIVKQLNEQ